MIVRSCVGLLAGCFPDGRGRKGPVSGTYQGDEEVGQIE